MGTPPASGPVDQMRRTHVTARTGGACAKKSNPLLFVRPAGARSTTTNAVELAGARTTFASAPNELLARGGAEGAVFFAELLQQLLLAQHDILHAFALLVFDRMHVRAESETGAQTIASAHKIDNETRPNMIVKL